MGVVYGSCNADNFQPIASSGAVGAQVTITGTNFGASQAQAL